MTILTVQLIVEFSKQVPGFESLLREDQITLLKVRFVLFLFSSALLPLIITSLLHSCLVTSLLPPWIEWERERESPVSGMESKSKEATSDTSLPCLWCNGDARSWHTDRDPNFCFSPSLFSFLLQSFLFGLSYLLMLLLHLLISLSSLPIIHDDYDGLHLNRLLPPHLHDDAPSFWWWWSLYWIWCTSFLCLQACSSEVMMLRCSRKYDIKTDSIVYANNQPYTRENYRSASIGEFADALFNFCRSTCILKVDNAEYSLLTAIIIFSGEFLFLFSFVDRQVLFS